MTETDHLRAGRKRSLEVVVVGHILNERVIFPDRVLYPVLGSPAAYSSICLARLGHEVGIVTKIGGDFPPQLLEVFEDVGVRKEGVITTHTSTRNELIYHPDGRKTLRFLSRADKIGYADMPLSYLESPIIYVCPMDHEIEEASIKRWAEEQRFMMVDLGGFGGATTERHSVDKEGTELRRLCPFFKVVKTSIEDLEYILGIDSGDYREASERLLGWGAATVVITLGREGAYVSTERKSMCFPAYLENPQAIMDPTGAGDCFAAGFLSEFLATQDPFAAAFYGNIVTSFVIQRTGGASVNRMPTKAEANQRAREMRARLSSR